jgi:DnaJ-class molecular chaperone
MLERIITCPSCKGTGKVERCERVDYHNRIDEEWDELCCVCGGTGRMVEQVSMRKLRNDELELRRRSPAGE